MATNRFVAMTSAIVALAVLAGSVDARDYYRSDRPTQTWYRSDSYRNRYRSDMVAPAGTPITVRLATKLETDEVQTGDTWTGTVTQSVVSDNRVLIPAGSQVTGVVTSSEQGTHSTQPSLGLAVRQVTVNGQVQTLNADTQPIVGGSNRAKKLGAIGVGAAAGALVGSAVGGTKSTVIGGILGGLTGYGATRHAFRNMQLKPGTEITFTTTENVAMRWR